jgi:hypothetical protein
MQLTTGMENIIPLNQKQQRFTHLYIVILLVCFSPSKALGALVPFIFLAGMLFYVQYLPKRHLLRYTVFLIFYSWIGGVYLLLYDGFSFGNLYFFLITGASLLILLYDFRGLITEHLIYKIVKLTSVILFFEACFGLTQVITGFSTTGTFDSATGDFVRGTIEPYFFYHAGSGSNQMFAILMSTFLLLVFIASKNWSQKRILLIGIVLLAFVMASVMHAIIFFIVAVFLAIIFKAIFGINLKRLFIISRRWRIFIILFGVVFMMGILVSIFLPRNLATLDIYSKQTLNFSSESHSPKTVASYLSIYNLPQDEPLQALIGIGLGQYSSRAALIRSGEYLSIGAIIPTYTTPYLDYYILPLWRNFKERFPSGASTYFPYYSWLSLYGETGWLGVFFAIGLLFVIAIKIIRHESVVFPYMQIGLLILIIYVALLGFQDNYWEWAQAIFPAFLILRLGTQYLFNEKIILYEQYANPS